MIDPAYESMLERYRTAWESGRFDQVIPAFMLCAAAGLPLPAWLSEAVLEDLEHSYRTRRRGGPMARTGTVQDHWKRVHGTRYRMMQTWLDQQAWALKQGFREAEPNMREAAAEIEDILKKSGSIAYGTIDAIIDSFKSLNNGGE